MFRLLIFLLIAGALAYCGATVKLGKRTFFGHVRAIWHTEEAQDLKTGVKENIGPTVDRVKRGVKKGYEAATHDEPTGSAGSGSQAAPAPASP